MSEPTRARRDLVFVDTEFDRLDLEGANLLEVAFAGEFGPVSSGVPPHSISGADPKALEVNRYYERGLGDRANWSRDIVDLAARATAGQTVVGANPRVDAQLLAREIGYEPWHYRLCDVESAAFLLLGFDQMPSLLQIQQKLISLGYQLPEPDHSAAGDVETLRAVFAVLRRIASFGLREAPTEAAVDAFESRL